jgi:hypothetical protein
MSTRVSALLAVAATGLLAASTAQAASTSSHLYECRTRSPKAASPPPQPTLQPEVAAQMREAIEADEFRPVCPAGEVPQPTGVMGPPARSALAIRHHRRRHGRRSPIATPSRQSYGGAWYSYATGYQNFNASKGVNGLWVQQTNEQPYIPYEESLAGAHSLGQLWGYRFAGGCWSTVETGWRESAYSYGDVYPHLFVAAFDCAAWLGYANKGLPWVQSSGVVFPGSALSHNDAFHVYGARMDGNNWWIYYDGQWVGYIPHSAWTSLFPWPLTGIEAGGEVATPKYETCADMGYAGLFGNNPGAAMFSDIWYEYNYNTHSSSASMYQYSSDPGFYSTGHWDAGYPGSEFRYGGPGWC